MLTAEQIDNWPRWAIKVPLGNDELYVTENERVVTYGTKEEAAKIWNRYRVVLYGLKTPENYLKLLNDALRIPSGPDWNYRFRKELKAKGLTLSMSIKDEEKVFYPNEFPVVAPLSYDLNDGWPKESLIVWEDTQ